MQILWVLSARDHADFGGDFPVGSADIGAITALNCFRHVFPKVKWRWNEVECVE